MVISGPSGTGKGTLCERLFNDDPSMRFSISVTTRKPRETETEGVHYFFVDDKRFDELLAQNAFLEHATVHGHRYGTLKSHVEELLAQNYNVVLDIDPQGARNVMAAMPDCVSVFLLPPSIHDLRVRLHSRNTDDPVEIERRVNNARGEIAQMDKYRYVIVNDDLELAYTQLLSVVAAEKQRTTRFFPVVKE